MGLFLVGSISSVATWRMGNVAMSAASWRAARDALTQVSTMRH